MTPTTELELVKALSNGLGTGVAVLVVMLILYRVLARVAERWIAAQDAHTKAIQDHTRVDLEHHAKVEQAVVRLEAKFDSSPHWRDRMEDSQRIRKKTANHDK